MITWREIAERVDKSEGNEAPIELYKLAEEFGLEGLCSITSEEFKKKNKGILKCYHIKRMCWESKEDRSLRMYFLDGVPMGISYHNPYTEYKWFSTSRGKVMKDYISEMIERDDTDYLEIIPIEDGLDNYTYKISDVFNAEMNKNTCLYKGEKVDSLVSDPNKENAFGLVITKSNKQYFDVPLSDLDFKIHILDEK